MYKEFLIDGDWEGEKLEQMFRDTCEQTCCSQTMFQNGEKNNLLCGCA